MRKALPLLLLLSLAPPAHARRESFQVHTRPPGAYVYLVVHGKPPSSDNPAQKFAPADYAPLPPGDLMGVADGGRLVTRDLPEDQTQVTLILLHPRCQPIVVTEDMTRLRASGGFDLPLNGEVYQLHYRSGADRWRDLMSKWGWTAGLALLALLIPLIAYLRRVQSKEALADAAQLRASMVTALIVPGVHEDPLIGTRLDEYRILELIGVGGMAKVYRGVPENTLDEGQSVAIKIMTAEMGNTPDLVQRFDREIKVYDGLHHPNIVKVMAAGEQSGHYFMVMELVRGHSLRSEVLPEGITPRKMLQLVTPIFEAVHFANKRGVVHRDLKPENVMVTAEGKIKVMDFGVARSHDSARVTATGSVLGTPGYIAPEQIHGILDVRSDQYALGIMCWEFLTGRRPFEDENPVTLIVKHLSEPVPSLAALRPDLEKFAKVLERMLAKKPEDRYRDLDLALNSLRYLL